MSTYKTTYEHVLYTILDNRILKRLTKQYKTQVDKLFNEEEQIQIRHLRTKLGKEFSIPEKVETNDLPKEFNIEGYVKAQMDTLKTYGLERFLIANHSSMKELCNYFTQTSNLVIPITSISFI